MISGRDNIVESIYHRPVYERNVKIRRTALRQIKPSFAIRPQIDRCPSILFQSFINKTLSREYLDNAIPFVPRIMRHERGNQPGEGWNGRSNAKITSRGMNHAPSDLTAAGHVRGCLFGNRSTANGYFMKQIFLTISQLWLFLYVQNVSPL